MDSVGASKRTSTPQVLFWTTGGGFLCGVSPKCLLFHGCSPGCLPLSPLNVNPSGIIRTTVIKKSQILTAERSSSERLMRGQSLWSRKTFKMAMESVTRKCFLNASHMAALSPKSCSNLLASSGGAAVRTRQACVEAGLRAYRAHAATDQRAYRAHAATDQLPASHLLGSMVAGNCLFDMATKDCGQKRHTVRSGTRNGQ